MSFAGGLLTAGLVGTGIFLIRHNAVKGQAKWIAETLAEGSDKPTVNIGAKRDPWGSVRCDACPYSSSNDLHHCDAEHLCFEDKQFSVALLSHVLEHLDNPEAALKEAQRVADNVVVVLPAPTDIATWADPTHRWVFLGEQKVKAYPSTACILLSSLAMAGFILWSAKRK